MDFLVEVLDNQGQLKPHCCVEVKSEGGDSWHSLIKQTRGYAA